MAFERFIEAQLLGVERFLASPEQVALEVERAGDLSMLAAKVIVAGQDDIAGRDIYIAIDHPFDDPESWCRAIFDAVAADLAASEWVLAEQGIEVVLPAGLDEGLGPIEVRLLEYLETVARELSVWARCLVLLWDPGALFDANTQAAWSAFATRLFAASGSGRVKWIVFAELGHPRIAGLAPERPRVQTWTEVVARYGNTDTLSRFVGDPLARVLTYRGDARAVEWFRTQFVRANLLGSRQTICLVVDGEGFVGPMWFYRVAGLAIAKQLRELELRSFASDERTREFVEQLEQPTAGIEAERWFARLLGRMLDALVKVPVVLVLAPDPKVDAPELAESVGRLASECVRADLSVIFVDPRLPERGIGLLTQAVASQRFDLDHVRIAAELRRGVEDPELPAVARIGYLSALSGLAIGESEPEKSIEYAVAAVAAAREFDDPAQLVATQYVLGNSLYHATGFDLAESVYSEALDASVTNNLGMLAAQALLGIGNCRFMQSDFDGARTAYGIAHTYYDKLGHRLGQIQALTWLAESAIRKQDWGTGRDEFERALELCDLVDPNYGQIRSNSKIEVLLRLARLFDTADMRTDAAQRRDEARTLGAVVEPASEPS